jgi:peptide/nickel transport system permease protein
MLRILTHRLAVSLPLLLGVSALSFVLVSLVPGNAASQILGITATPSEEHALSRELGLNLPVYTQYWRWLIHAVTGNFGTSLYSGQSVTGTLDQRLPVTLCLMLGAVIVSLVAGVIFGVVSAVRGGIAGRVVDVFSLVGFALPAFWVGGELVVLFAVKSHVFPVSGYVSPGQSVTQWFRSLTLPVFALSLAGIAGVTRLTRSAMLEALGAEHIRIAWANGLAPRSIIFRHALRNASLPIVTVVGVQAIGLLGGTVLVESVFDLPGLGSLAVSATENHDLPVLQGLVVYFTVMVVVINLLVDVAYILLNPKVRRA